MKHYKCTSCGSKIVVRTQVGHQSLQEHSFNCPTCDIKITFALILDQANASGTVPEPKNATWVASEDAAITTLAFSDELPVPLDIRPELSPFLATFWNFKDLNQHEKYLKDETFRKNWIRNDWPTCDRCMTHYERNDWNLYDRQFPASYSKSPDPLSRLGNLYEAIHAGFSKFTRNTPGVHQRIKQRLALAETISHGLVSKLASDWLSSGKLQKLWNEIRDIRRTYVNNYTAISPLLQITYWREDLRDLLKIKVSGNYFDALRQLYIDCFETLWRLLVIATGMETIIDEHTLNIRTKKGSITLEQFEQFPNGTKPDIFKRYPIADLFLALRVSAYFTVSNLIRPVRIWSYEGRRF